MNGTNQVFQDLMGNMILVDQNGDQVVLEGQILPYQL